MDSTFHLYFRMLNGKGKVNFFITGSSLTEVVGKKAEDKNVVNTASLGFHFPQGYRRYH